MPTNRSATRLDLDKRREEQKALAGPKSTWGWPVASQLESPPQSSYARHQTTKADIMHGFRCYKRPGQTDGVRLGHVTGGAVDNSILLVAYELPRSIDMHTMVQTAYM